MIEKLLDEPYWNELPEEINSFREHAKSISYEVLWTLSSNGYSERFVRSYVHYRLGQNHATTYNEVFKGFNKEEIINLLSPTSVKESILQVAHIFISNDIKLIDGRVIFDHDQADAERILRESEASMFVDNQSCIMNVELIMENLLSTILNRSQSSRT